MTLSVASSGMFTVPETSRRVLNVQYKLNVQCKLNVQYQLNVRYQMNVQYQLPADFRKSTVVWKVTGFVLLTFW